VQFVGDVHADMVALLTHHELPKTAGHKLRVAAEAKRLAHQFGVNPGQAEVAGWLHDVSAVFPSHRRLEIAEAMAVTVLPEEQAFPMIVHQKLSLVLALDLFGVRDEATLSAIGCHTTLRAKATPLDKVVFVADKIAWDQEGEPPYLAELLRAVVQSLDRAALCYLSYLWRQRDRVPVVHAWMADAYHQLSAAAQYS
ncbi:MAG TPA: bis(5'-nucleosyl)-tetraphosphatase (symmetrical) YqeK, partial [Ardenticatenaceae bacterium]|nr:bis(5'-nucleosyl)-tetraphosphatase (symmetrical) YqeK [Ardenticatenaceae bacterium]